MRYLSDRSLYYYFLMREVTDAGTEAWGFIAKNFGVKSKEIKAYESVLSDRTLDDLTTIGDIEMYKNFLNGFCVNETEFGKSRNEQDAIEAKALALHKIEGTFGETLIKSNRLRSLSHNYERDHVSSVLYALQLMYLNSNKECARFAEGILSKELKEGKNSDAGLILLNMKEGGKSEIVTTLKSLPDLLLRPDMQKYLSKQCGSGVIILNDKPTIGF